MKRLLIAITALLLAITASAQSPYSYKYGKLYHEETMLTKKNASDFLNLEETKQYKGAQNMFISGSGDNEVLPATEKQTQEFKEWGRS